MRSGVLEFDHLSCSRIQNGALAMLTASDHRGKFCEKY